LPDYPIDSGMQIDHIKTKTTTTWTYYESYCYCNWQQRIYAGQEEWHSPLPRQSKCCIQL
jgi:hypothetical protein